jgi:hypothetical protein
LLADFFGLRLPLLVGACACLILFVWALRR